MATKIVHLWCGPRSMSTCTMYSFGQRSDAIVLDEPLYASYLARRPKLFRPYREELIQAQNPDGNIVLNEIKDMVLPEGKSVVFCKNLAKQLAGLDRSLLLGPNIYNVFLVRDPYMMISSWEEKSEVHFEPCSLESTCMPAMVELFSELRQAHTQGLVPSAPLVIDSDLLRHHPREVLQRVSELLGLPFEESQLHWSAGPKSYDGLWAPYWYEQVWRSTGFGSFSSKSSATESTTTSDSCSSNGTTTSEDGPRQNGKHRQYVPLGPTQVEVYRECLPFYTLLRRHAIGIDSLCPGSSTPPLDLTCAVDKSSAKLTRLPYIPQRTLAIPSKRNEDILVWVGDRLYPRDQAKVSVFDSAVQGGDACWEGLRVYSGRVFMLDEHLLRLQDSARALGFKNVPSNEFITHAITWTLAANNMRTDCHIRLTLTRGAKITSSMNPNFNVFGCNLIVLAEWKLLQDATTYNNDEGVRLVTAAGRRNSPQCVDSKIHHCNLINNILPKIQANLYGAADALMLDPEGYVSETNATNVFMVKGGKVFTPHADYCLPGVTRGNVLDLCKELGIEAIERRISLAEFHAADEAFTTGTMGGITPIVELDGRVIGSRGPITKRIQEAYQKLTETLGYRLPDF